MAETITCGAIARRLGLSRWAAWKWSRRGRFGPPIDPTAKLWRWADDAILAENLRMWAGQVPRQRTRSSLWADAERQNLKTLNAIAGGAKQTDAEDLQMAAVLLSIASRRFLRRAAGQKSPATVCALVVLNSALRKDRRHDSDIPQRLSATSLRLSRLAESGNGSMPET